MYRLSARQILLIAVASALFAAITVVGVQQLSSRFQPFASALARARVIPLAWWAAILTLIWLWCVYYSRRKSQ